MSVQSEEILNNLKDKIAVLMNQYSILKEENTNLKNENSKLNNIIKLNKKQTSELENKYNNIKLAKTIEGADDNSHDAKLRVNKIVREIDKCIALLNK